MILIIENDYMLVNFWFLHRFGHILFYFISYFISYLI